MSSRPIFVATHPRACSTAFERVFMQRRDVLTCVHEPFGDAFYYGPERLSERYEGSEQARLGSGCSRTTYKSVVDQLERDNEEKRLFIKDMAYYLFSPDGKATQVAPSLSEGRAAEVNGIHQADGVNGTSGSSNPTVLPTSILKRFHFTFLIRHPRRAIPSFWRCTVPPLREVTGFSPFLPGEAGYVELRRLLDFLKEGGLIGPSKSGEAHGAGNGVAITVIDADDLLDDPERVVKAFCQDIGLDFSNEMLQWGDDESQQFAAELFGKWTGFHKDVLESTSLTPRSHHAKNPSIEAEDEDWRKKYGDEAQKIIRDCVNANVPDYEYLKSFAL